MSISYKHFFWIVIGCFAATLLPILVLNLILVNNSLDSRSNTRLASQWQQATHGTVSPPSVLENQVFKALRLNDRLPGINAVILGSSTSYAITQEMFPESMHVYNFSKNGNPLNNIIGEAEYLLDRAPHVKWLLIPLEWTVPPGYLYEEGDPSTVDIAAQAASSAPSYEAGKATWLQRVQDSLSYPRIAGLFQLMRSMISAKQKYSAFRQLFLQPASDEYLCPDGRIAKDFDIQHRNTCTGFRYDGSWTYAGHDRVNNAHALIMTATASNSRYTANLLKTRGAVNPVFLEHLAAIARRARERGGDAVFVIPPLLPGMEKEFLQHPLLGKYLQRTRQELSRWAQDNRLTVLDAAQSEQFGCTASDFTDPHHATSDCLRKIFAIFWQNPVTAEADPNRILRNSN